MLQEVHARRGVGSLGEEVVRLHGERLQLVTLLVTLRSRTHLFGIALVVLGDVVEQLTVRADLNDGERFVTDDAQAELPAVDPLLDERSNPVAVAGLHCARQLVPIARERDTDRRPTPDRLHDPRAVEVDSIDGVTRRQDPPLRRRQASVAAQPLGGELVERDRAAQRRGTDVRDVTELQHRLDVAALAFVAVDERIHEVGLPTHVEDPGREHGVWMSRTQLRDLTLAGRLTVHVDLPARRITRREQRVDPVGGVDPGGDVDVGDGMSGTSQGTGDLDPRRQRDIALGVGAAHEHGDPHAAGMPGPLLR
jgi:hypothetical protein